MLYTGEWATLEVHWPGRPCERIGLLLHDQTDNIVRFRIRDDWSVPDGEEELWRDLNADLERMAAELGVQQMLEWLDNTASHVFRLGTRKAVIFSDIEAVLDTLYNEHVIGGAVIESEQAKHKAMSHNGSWKCALSTSGSFLALAANIALVAVWSVAHHSSQAPATTAEMVQKGSAHDLAPPLLSEAFPTRLVDVTLPAELSSSAHRVTAVRSPRHRSFHLDKRQGTTVRVNTVRTAMPSQPSFPIVAQTLPSEVALSLPRSPDFRPENRFIHALMASFRTVGRVFVDHQNSPVSKTQHDD